MLYVSTKLDTSTYCEYFPWDFKKKVSAIFNCFRKMVMNFLRIQIRTGQLLSVSTGGSTTSPSLSIHWSQR